MSQPQTIEQTYAPISISPIPPGMKVITSDGREGSVIAWAVMRNFADSRQPNALGMVYAVEGVVACEPTDGARFAGGLSA